MNSCRSIGIAWTAAALLTTGLLFSAGPAGADEIKPPPGDRPPPDVFSRVEDAGTAVDHEGADYMIVYDYTFNYMKPSGVTNVDHYIIYKVLTPAGCRSQSVLTWNFDPQSMFVDVKEVNVIRRGERIPVDVGGVHELPAPQAWIYWKDRIKMLQLPRLQANDGIEVKVFQKGFTYALLDESAGSGGSGGPPGGGSGGQAPDDDRYIPPMPGEYFDIVLFAASVPVIEKRYTLSLPADKRLHSEIYNGPLYSSTTFSEDRSEYSWWGLDLPPTLHESRQPDQSDYVSKVVMATVESWEAKSRWFFEVNRNQFEVTSDIQRKVDEILAEAGLTNASEAKKAEALVHWVAQNIRYSGQTMGEGEGFTLHPGQMIFEQRSGVCKDIAGMLITMMRAAGLNSFAAMTMAGSRIEEIPADQFNHCVCALRKTDGSFEMYDPTWVPFNNDIWSLLEAEQHYLIGTPEGEYLSRIPYSPPEESPLRITHDARLNENGSLEGTFKLSGSGAMDGRLRRMVAYTQRGELTDRFSRLLHPVSDRVEIIQYDFLDPTDFSEDMWITVRYSIPRFALLIDGGFEFASPMMKVLLGDGDLFRAAQTDWAADRTTDVFLYYTQLLSGTESLRLPKDYRIENTPASEEVDETYAYFKGGSRMKSGALMIESRAEIRRRQIPPNGYAGFKRAIDKAKEWSNTIFRVEKGGKS